VAGAAARAWHFWRLWVLWWALALASCFALVARAAEAPALTLERTSDGLYLSARAPLDLPPALEDALHRGVPVHFVWQAELRRSRWYWTDQRLAQTVRTVRVVYQPLTRRWRVSLGSGPMSETGLTNALHQNLDTLDDALAAVRRVTRWRVANPSDLDDGADKLEVQFRLDAGLLPRPFQIGAGSTADAPPVFRQVLAVPPERTPPVESAGQGAE